MSSIVTKFDDEVSVKEMNRLMRAMEADTSGRFPPAAIFHYALRNNEREATALRHGINVTSRIADGSLVGYMRIVTDHAYIYYIVDVMVHPGYQGSRIGSTMVQAALDELKRRGFIKVLLTAIPGKEEFYGRMGFKPTMSPVMALRGEDYGHGG
jgi:GNAT superfamily N-acetyltransferase